MTPASTPESASAVDHQPEPGRPIELVPMPRGSWPLLLGSGMALLGPLFGFLIGSAVGPADQPVSGLNPMMLSLFVGFVVGGLGVLFAMSGAWALYLSFRRGEGTR